MNQIETHKPLQDYALTCDSFRSDTALMGRNRITRSFRTNEPQRAIRTSSPSTELRRASKYSKRDDGSHRDDDVPGLICPKLLKARGARDGRNSETRYDFRKWGGAITRRDFLICVPSLRSVRVAEGRALRGHCERAFLSLKVQCATALRFPCWITLRRSFG